MADLGLMQRRGMTPKQAVDAILAEAKARHPREDTIIIQRNGDGFDILSVI